MLGIADNCHYKFCRCGLKWLELKAKLLYLMDNRYIKDIIIIDVGEENSGYAHFYKHFWAFTAEIHQLSIS